MKLADIEQYLIRQNDETRQMNSEEQLARAKYFLDVLGNPQEKIKTIHVAGTSGKGSTSYLASILLHAHGFTVGLFQSPHILDIREMFQLNNHSISEEKFSHYFQKIIQFVEKAKTGQYGAISAFDILTGLAFYIFHKEHVDYAVIETGLGGLYDSTNVIQNKDKLVILTKIGLDHTELLGDTLTAIATHKAGIIQQGNVVIAIAQEKEVEKVFEETAKKQTARIFFIREDAYSIASLETMKTVFTFHFLDTLLQDIILGLPGSFQVENCSEALAAVVLLSKRDTFALDKKNVYTVLEQARIPGRLEIRRVKNKLVILDGAHNPQKMQLFIHNVKMLFPNKRFDFLIAVKKGKDYPDMLQHIVSIANNITITSFHVRNMTLKQDSEDPSEIAKALDRLHFTHYEIVPDAVEAVIKVLQSPDATIITGSLYFIATVYPTVNTLSQ